MVKRVVQKEYRNFSGGLITEASPLTFPENTAVDIDNLVLNYDGTVQRRNGLSQVGSNLQTALASSPTNQGSYVWKDAGGDFGNDFYVVKLVDQIHFYQCNGTTSIDATPDLSLRLEKLLLSVRWTTNYTNGWSGIDATDLEIEFTDNGKFLFIAGSHFYPICVKNKGGTTFEILTYNIMARDLFGADDGHSLEDQPTALSNPHQYNLRNQGWTDSQITAYNAAASAYPANNQSPHVGWRPAANAANENWQASQIQGYAFGSTPAPKGDYVASFLAGIGNKGSKDYPGFTISNLTYSAGTWTATTTRNHGLAVGETVMFINTLVSYTDTSANTVYFYIDSDQIATVPTGTTFTFSYSLPDYSSGFTVEAYGTVFKTYGGGGGTHIVAPSTIAQFAGRVWHTGYVGTRYDPDAAAYIKHVNNGHITFSQLFIEEASDFEFPHKLQNCFQENSPASREFNALLDTDGGSIKINDCTNIRKLLPLERSLLVFADNGVWEVGPGSLGYFTATSYSINKISDVGVQTKESVIAANNIPFYQGTDGDLYLLNRNPQTGRFEPKDLTETTIRSSIAGKTIIKAAHDVENKRVVWLNDDNTALVFDLRLGVWYKWTFKDTTNTKLDMVYCPSLNADSRLVFISYDASNNVQQFTLTDATFEDDGTDAAAYIVTGYELLDTSSRDKQSVYITTHFNRTETQFIDDGGGGPLLDPQSGCQMKAQWDWDLTGDANRHSGQQQVYRFVRPYVAPAGPYPVAFDYGFGVITTKNKVRGKGKALALRFDSEAGKDMQLLGWSTSYTGNSRD